jgi:ABC-type Fe3+-hydroxamate transport system substrate-binding protein
MGNRIQLSGAPFRIVSLVPSQTELLFDLGLDNEVVGITKFCVHPNHWKNEKAIVGGTKNFDIKLIDQLKPDLVIGNKEENYQEGIAALQKKYPVWMSEMYSFEHALEMIARVGELVERQQQSANLVEEIKTSFKSIKKYKSQKVLYLIWKKPWMAAGTNTFINSMLSKIGLENCLPEASRYPELSNVEITTLNPEIVFLSSEPYPFKEKHIHEIQDLLPNAKIMLVDGEMFSWYGSRLRKAGAYFDGLDL